MSFQKTTALYTASEQQVKYKYLGWYSRVMENETRRVIHRLVKQNAVLHELHSSVVTKQELSSTASCPRDPSYIGLAMCPECPTKDWQDMLCWLHPQESSNTHGSGPEVIQQLGGVTTSPTLLGPILMWSQQNYQRWLLY